MSYTALPNAVIDKHLPDLSGAELKVLLVIVRQTRGWHKKHDAIALSQFESKTGLSKPSIIAALRNLEARKLIVKHHQGKVCAYSLPDCLDDSEVGVKKVDLCHTDIGKKSLPTKEIDTNRQTNKAITESFSLGVVAVSTTLSGTERNSTRGKKSLPMEVATPDALRDYWLRAQERAPLKARRRLDETTAQKWIDDATTWGLDLKAIIDRAVRVATIDTKRLTQKLIDDEVGSKGANDVVSEPKVDAVLDYLYRRHQK